MWEPPPDFEADPPSKELAGKGTVNIVEDFPFKSPITVNIKDLLLLQRMTNKNVTSRKITSATFLKIVPFFLHIIVLFLALQAGMELEVSREGITLADPPAKRTSPSSALGKAPTESDDDVPSLIDGTIVDIPPDASLSVETFNANTQTSQKPLEFVRLPFTDEGWFHTFIFRLHL